MNRKALLFIAVLFLMVAANASAQTTTGVTADGVKYAIPTEGPEYTLSVHIFDKYLGADGGVFYDGPVLQPDIFVSFQNGFYADLWASRGNKGGWGDDFDSEIDFNVGWANDHLDVGALYLLSPPSASNVIELYATVTTNEFAGGIKAFIGLEHYFAMSGNDPARGTITRLGLTGGAEFGRNTFEWKVDAFYDTGAFGYSDGTLAEGEATLLHALESQWFSFGPTVKVTTPIHLTYDDGRELDYAVGLVSQITF